MRFKLRLIFIPFIIAVTCLHAQEKTRIFQPPLYPPVAVLRAPYSAQSTFESSFTAANGNRRLSKGDLKQIYRDGSGRVRTEEPAISGSTPGTGPLMIEIDDVVAGARYILDVQKRVAHRSVYPPARPHPRPMTATANRPKYESVTEKLGTQTFDGIVAEGTRTTMTYPAGTWGWERPVSTSSEFWMAKDLRITVLSKNVQPDSQEFVTKLTQVSRAEPDAALFLVPPGYTIVDEPGAFSIDYSGQ